MYFDQPMEVFLFSYVRKKDNSLWMLFKSIENRQQNTRAFEDSACRHTEIKSDV